MNQIEIQHTYQRLKTITRVAVGVGIAAITGCLIFVIAANISAGAENWFLKILPSALYLLALFSGLVILAHLIHRPRYKTPDKALKMVRHIKLAYFISTTILIFIIVLGAVGAVMTEIGIETCKNHLCIQEIIEKTNLIKTTFSIEAFTAWTISLEVKVILYYCSHLLKKAADIDVVSK